VKYLAQKPGAHWRHFLSTKKSIKERSLACIALMDLGDQADNELELERVEFDKTLRYSDVSTDIQHCSGAGAFEGLASYNDELFQ
jgi:hypothetical protein